MGKVIAISNLKGGVGKTTTAVSLSAGLARYGKSVLCLDSDPQRSLTVSLGITKPETLTETLAVIFTNLINEIAFDPTIGIIRHAEGMDILPSNNTLAGVELAMSGLIGREAILKQYIEMVKPLYDYIIIDCSPSLSLLTINALAASDSVIIPVVPQFLDALGLELLLKSISKIQQQINNTLEIGGILLTMVDKRGNFTKDIISLVENTYGDKVRIFSEYIPRSIRASESTAQGVSIFTHNPKGKVSAAYNSLVKEVMSDGN